MTLDEIKALAKPGQKFIREPNSKGYVSVWFTCENDVLMAHTRSAEGVYSRRAPKSPYPPTNDWIFYPKES